MRTLYLYPFLLLFSIWLTYYLTKRSNEKYWRGIINAQQIPTYWDAEPICPYCGNINEAAYGLEDDEVWHPVICSGCEQVFYVKHKFELTHKVAKEKPE